MTRYPSSMTPAEKKATDAVVRAAKRWQRSLMFELGLDGKRFRGDPIWANAEHSFYLERAVSRLLREEAKRKGGKRG